MAYIDQAKKKELAPGIRAVLGKYGVKGTIAVRNHCVLVVNLKSGRLPIMENFNTKTDENETYTQVNHYHLDKAYTGEVLEFLTELVDAMNVGNYRDFADVYQDAPNVGWYITINVGSYQKLYEVEQ